MALNDGPTLDWSTILFHTPVAPDDWYRMLPEARLVEALRIQALGNVPLGELAVSPTSATTQRRARRNSSK